MLIIVSQIDVDKKNDESKISTEFILKSISNWNELNEISIIKWIN